MCVWLVTCSLYLCHVCIYLFTCLTFKAHTSTLHKCSLTYALTLYALFCMHAFSVCSILKWVQSLFTPLESFPLLNVPLTHTMNGHNTNRQMLRKGSWFGRRKHTSTQSNTSLHWHWSNSPPRVPRSIIGVCRIWHWEPICTCMFGEYMRIGYVCGFHVCTIPLTS